MLYANLYCSGNEAVLLAPAAEKPKLLQMCATAEAGSVIGHLNLGPSGFGGAQ